MDQPRKSGPRNPNRKTPGKRPRKHGKKRRIERAEPAVRGGLEPTPSQGGAAPEPARVLQQVGAYWSAIRPYGQRVLDLSVDLLALMVGFALRHRMFLFRASHRAAWWIALAIMLIVGQALLGGLEAGALTDAAHVYFGVGLGLCAAVLFFAAERRLRVASFLLGTGHGAMALMAWLVSQ